ncbi:MAG TPA: PepSY domain-containing protein [Burkholderiales bacterium]|nr:PepSY domain-containing protein [Burkholderiales bacterium]
MKPRFFLVALALCGALAPFSAARATGLATCDSGSRESWQPQAKLSAILKDRGWQVRRIKEDGGCYEVYALNEKGERVEAYFHPRTLAPVPTGSKDHKG